MIQRSGQLTCAPTGLWGVSVPDGHFRLLDDPTEYGVGAGDQVLVKYDPTDSDPIARLVTPEALREHHLCEPKKSHIPAAGYVPCSDFNHKAIRRNCHRVKGHYYVVRSGYITQGVQAYHDGYFMPIYLEAGSVFRIHSLRALVGRDGVTPDPNSIVLLGEYAAQALVKKS